MKSSRRFRWIFAALLMWSGCDSAQTEMARVDKLKKEIAEALDIEAWVLGSMPIQPLVVGIIRSMEPASKITQLRLERDAETPSQLRMRLVLNTASDKQIAQTLEAIHKLNYRESSQTIDRSNGEFVYTTRLIWQGPKSQTPQTPEQRQTNPGTIPSAPKIWANDVDAGGEDAQSEELRQFVNKWKPHFALVEDQQETEARINMKVREADMLTLSQRYEQVPHKIANRSIASLPTLMRATLVFDDSYGKLLNWLGTIEKSEQPTRVGKIDLSSGSRGDHVRMELTLEVPLLRQGS
jgi:hypothetical protein